MPPPKRHALVALGSRSQFAQFLTHNLRAFVDYLNGGAPRPLTTLADCRPFVRLNDLLFVAANHIQSVDERFLRRESNPRGDFISIENIAHALHLCAQSGALPSETGFGWSAPGGRAVAGEIAGLESVITRLAPVVESAI